MIAAELGRDHLRLVTGSNCRRHLGVPIVSLAISLLVSQVMKLHPGDCFTIHGGAIVSPTQLVVYVEEVDAGLHKMSRHRVKLAHVIDPPKDSPAFVKGLGCLSSVLRIPMDDKKDQPIMHDKDLEPPTFLVRGRLPDQTLVCQVTYTRFEPSVDFQFMAVDTDLSELLVEYGLADFTESPSMSDVERLRFRRLRESAQEKEMGMWAKKTND